jgi:hypothetical protein
MLTGIVSYKDNFGNTKSLPIKPLEISSVCPFLEKYELPTKEFPLLGERRWNSYHIDRECKEIYKVYKKVENNVIELGYSG